ncbi:double-strand break repair helicase AddA [Amorphus coralli]|uniref:double-strand break repair helicase AddA n=1 Tax=Amorphus coralli TaxID=340680 RepID=UPI0003823231|nr:double-strand break repair helicase AddA [Amorphus coralli]
MTVRAIPEATLLAQAQASDPGASAWVSANAGSGKTHVLVERVVNLLLSGVAPGRILCLTFTNAAAAQMSQRVFDRLAAFTRADDATLDKLLSPRLGRAPAADDRADARRLFAEALETPGGLKIQTIHAFCAALLHQFPLEANLAARFTVLDDAASAELCDDAIEKTLAEAAAAPDGPLARAIAAILPLSADLTLLGAIRAMIREREAFRAWLTHADGLDGAIAELRAALGLAPGDTLDALTQEILTSPGFDAGFRSAYAEALARGSAADLKRHEQLRLCGDVTVEPAARVEAWQALFLTAAGAPRAASGAGTKAVQAALPDLAGRYADEQARLLSLLDKAAAIRAVSVTAALACLADRALGHMEVEKAREGLVDYDDQIARTALLLARSDAAQWIHYKLDRGIDHILVDEAQDTSPRQWEIVNALAGEFFAGQGAHEKGPRTVFAVGDEKQSIYGFQGAAPDAFHRQHGHFEGLATGIEAAFHSVQLTLSFRSTPDVLGAVDAVFADPDLAQRIASDGTATVHEPIRANEPGRVTLWPLMETVAAEAPEDWTQPIDHEAGTSGPWQLAERIAETIRDWLASGARHPNGAPVKAGDILVLLRKRQPFADLVNRALKAAGVPVAGADRLTVTEHIAVEDLIALGRALLTPADDLSLACVLKCPLFGLDEETLFEIAHDRPGTLEASLRDAGAADPRLASIAERLARWRRIALADRPFDLYATVLGADEGRRLFRGRLGSEVDEVLDAFLDMALDYERTGVPTLEGFLVRVTASAAELKRESDAASDAVRVMTVHGAKGLEARIVFLVDGCGAPLHAAHDPKIVPLPPAVAGAAAPLVWAPNGDHRPQAVTDVIEAGRDRQEAEYARLLYVAMTRAMDQLIVCGWSPARGPHERCWYKLIETGLAGALVDITAEDGKTLVAREWRGITRERGEQVTEVRAETVPAAPPLPAWARTPAPPPVIEAPSLSPSRALPHASSHKSSAPAGSQAGQPGLAPEAARRAAMLRGTIAHRLLEVLPDLAPDQRADAARRLVAAQPGADTVDADALIASVLAILEAPEFAAVFGPGSRAEVGLAGHLTLAGARRLVTGRVDRMVRTPGKVLIVDYKSDRPVPDSLDDVPPAYIAQLALYREIMRPLEPDAEIGAALVWTDTARLMPVPGHRLDAVLAALDRAGRAENESPEGPAASPPFA